MLLKTTNLQNQASNPLNSAFVSASAGSGKTKVLTDRVLRLLLCGVMPSKILCLTFTKVAAAQMQKRIFAKLEDWAICDHQNLCEQLEKFTQSKPSQAQIKTARQLFATLLDDNSGLQISTIHSFCQSIIKKFPVEAKTSPSFAIIDAQKETELLFLARKELLKQALFDNNLAEKINLISARLNENSFLEITSELIKKRQNLAELKEKYFDIKGIVGAVFEQIGVDLEADEQSIFNNFIADKNWHKEDLLNLCKATAIKNGQVIEKFISQPNLENYQQYFAAFLTNENEPRKQLTTKIIQKQIPEAEQIMRLEQERIVQFLEKLNSVKIAVATSALLVVVDKIITIYSHLKNQNGYLDYSDLIIKTSQLLENATQREWVKYKLDGIYEHILVDESQDTNHQQWNIVKAITEEFFAGQGIDQNLQNQERTIFIVGDEKQSIYSFQGADPNIFANIFYYYQNKLAVVNQQFLNVELNSSFRSLPAILKVVDQIFSQPELQKSISNLSEKITHNPIKTESFGKVELMPIVSCSASTSGYGAAKEEEKYKWDLDFSIDEEYKAQEILAQIIAKKIKSFFSQNKFLASKNRFAEFKDVMILLKERQSNLGNLLVKYLQAEQIPVSSADRIHFGSNIVVQDLLALAKFILLPEDDLNLACLLKSPFYNISEEDLLSCCLLKNQSQTSLFQALKHNNLALYQELQNLILTNLEQQFSIQQFFSYVLIRQNKQKAILSRFGKAGQEIINQFLKIILDYQSNNIAVSLQNFVQFLENSDLEIKIDSNGQNLNQVFITTVHSAKGLEAPIVFLADTMHNAQKQFGNDRRRIFWDHKTSLPFWSGGKNFDNATIKNIKKIDREIIKKEYWRQLYVAMTRAEEELYICGFAKKINDQDCWYNVIKSAVINDAKVVDNFLDAQFGEYLSGQTLLIGNDVFADDLIKKTDSNISQQIAKNETGNDSKMIYLNRDQSFIDKLPDLENSEEFLYPSQIDQANKINSQKANLGKIIHKILEFLPELKFENIQAREKFLEDFLIDSDVNKNLNTDQIGKIIKQIDDIFCQYPHLFSQQNSKAEVPIIAKINGKTISGKIDRLVINEKEVLIVDFKTGEKNDNSQLQYQGQMQLYEQVLQKLYPDKQIKSQIIWLDQV